ncbi:hypothetical protein [Candidatus Nitrosocosmicus franklandus]|uniref:Uncharacterized protein n=1 Tax=Candidatus Nitrosocosmicus franklandianus TaxID=1798806 RepID=A0A484IDC0_9ARCH|nr:hypothetical protein [Candidatus Nitrosocosmicus franklandus]VFJ14727.1 protein of unknown function [Candidatus Nitrosocosmicus franklandus]
MSVTKTQYHSSSYCGKIRAKIDISEIIKFLQVLTVLNFMFIPPDPYTVRELNPHAPRLLLRSIPNYHILSTNKHT